MEKQIVVGALLPFIPVFIGEVLFFVLVMAARVDIMLSFAVSLSFSSFGMVLWYMWRDSVRREIVNYEPINATLRWSREIVTYENQMITGRVSLKDEQIVRPVEYTPGANTPSFQSPPTYKKEVLYYSQRARGYIRQVVDVAFQPKSIKIGINEYVVGNPELVESLLAGKKSAEVNLHHNSVAPNGIPYKKMQFIHNFPYQDDFFLCPDQFVIHQAQFLTDSSSVVDAVFLYWGERGEPIPVFLVVSSPAIADMVQKSIGMKPVLQDKDGGKELRMEIEDAVRLGDATQSIGLAQILRARTNTLQEISDSQGDVEDLGYAAWAEWERNEREIESPIRKAFDLSDWRVLFVVVFGVVTSAAVIWWLWFR